MPKMAHFKLTNEKINNRVFPLGQETWSSGYGKRLMSESCGFECRHLILDGHFFSYNCCKNCNVCLKRPKINKKEAGICQFFKKTIVRLLYRTRQQQ